AALAIAHEKARVAVMARTQTDVEAMAKECKRAGAKQALPICADATDDAALKAAIDTTVKEFGGLDVLVTLVGGSQPGGTADAEWEAAFDRNLWPSVRASRYALPHLIAGAVRRGFAAQKPAQVEPPSVPRE